MRDVLAIVPARSGSKGIPNKNFRLLAGVSPVIRAYETARVVATRVVVSTDRATPGSPLLCGGIPDGAWLPHDALLYRPAALAQDDTPMIAVVQHVLETIPGQPEQIILLVQPTQPLRQPKHLTAAIDLLVSSGADSVVSVVALPPTHSPDMVCEIWHERRTGARLAPWNDGDLAALPTRRQDVSPVYIRDGTVYACRRSTVTTHGTLYGDWTRPLLIPAEETCPLDTPADWAEAERRLQALLV